MSRSLLPPNCTDLERDLDSAILSRYEKIDVPIKTIWSPYDCPAELLPWLAWQFSVDSWDSDWTENEKRSTIANSFYIHKKKGTISALRKVVEPLGFLLKVINWYEVEPQGAPHTFELKIGILEKGITDAMYSQMSMLIDDAKGCRDHLLGLQIVGETQGNIYVSVSTSAGDLTTIYPYSPEMVSVGGEYIWGSRTHLIDYTRVEPHE